MRISSRIIIFKGDEVLLNYREKNGEKYYAFPGGGLEENETIEECAIREAKEELGIDISIKRHIYDVKGLNFFQHFFLVSWDKGKMGTGDEEEYNPNRLGGLQVPMFVKIDILSELNVVSPSIVKHLLEDISKYGLELDTKMKEIVE